MNGSFVLKGGTYTLLLTIAIRAVMQKRTI